MSSVCDGVILLDDQIGEEARFAKYIEGRLHFKMVINRAFLLHWFSWVAIMCFVAKVLVVVEVLGGTIHHTVSHRTI